MLTAERLRERLHYDPKTGVFRWSASPVSRIVGEVAGRVHKKRGYREIYVDGKLYYAHRLAWLYMTGQWPVGLIDHKDHDRANNSWANLRLSDHSTNGQNRRGAQANSGTGVLGVSRNGSGFRARLQVNGRELSLGTFPTIEQAAAVHAAAKPLYHAT